MRPPLHALRRTTVALRQWLRSSELAFIALAMAVGVLAGVSTAAQGWLAHGIQGLLFGVTSNRLSALATIHHPWKLLALPLGGLLLLLMGQALSRHRRTPIDVVEANALHGGRIPVLDNLVIAAQTILSNGCGASVGLEATYAQMGGGIASLLGQLLRLRRADLRNLVGAGAGAAVGAAFGAPLTGAFYAFEIVIGAYSTASVAPVIAAALAAVLVLRGLHSEPYLIATTVTRAITIVDYGAYAALGSLCALVGIGVMRLVTIAERWFQAWPWLARWRPVVGGVILAGLALLSPQTLSSGHGALHLDLVLQPPLALLLFVFALKVVASIISLASGFRGGLFFASLFLGSLLGQAFAQMFNLNPWGLALSPVDAALVGMAGLSVSIVGGPMTLALLMLETTHDFALMGVVLTAALISTSLTRELFGYSFSTWRLHVRGSDIRSPRDIGWMLTLTAGRMMRRDWISLEAGMTIAHFRQTVPLGATTKAIVTDADGHYQGIVATAAAYAPQADPMASIGSLAGLAETTLNPATGIKTVLACFDSAMADELAVVNAQGKVVGILTERHTRRRYLEEIEAAQRKMFGEMGR
ncbi:chloride channel protein [Novosphingobium sp. FSY-8]|uniref:Chloride channel protein n=2 Tax=Novosphingobium ovatum TaxID=1908523 RepID=A0ABW9XF99_9SPHN|nr:chloride channel protein [Novosphingobium ovatum]